MPVVDFFRLNFSLSSYQRIFSSTLGFKTVKLGAAIDRFWPTMDYPANRPHSVAEKENEDIVIEINQFHSQRSLLPLAETRFSGETTCLTQTHEEIRYEDPTSRADH